MPVRVGLGPAYWELLGCFDLDYYVVVLGLVFHNLDREILLFAQRVQISIDFNLAVLGLRLEDVGVLMAHGIVQLSGENVVLILKCER